MLVDGEPRLKSHRLTGGETVELEPPAPPGPLEPEEVPLRVADRRLYEAKRASAA